MAALLLLFTSGCTPKPEITPTPTPAATLSNQTPGTTPKDFLQIGFDLMASETLGGIRLNMTDGQLIALFGQPENKTTPQVWGSDGLEHTTWNYVSRGLSLNLSKKPDSKDAAVVFSIRAASPCTLSTKRGIRIGDSREAVMTVYRNEIDESASSADFIVIGSVYGGIIVNFKEGRVSEIFIGAAAE
jgi:hypothetical protein